MHAVLEKGTKCSASLGKCSRVSTPECCSGLGSGKAVTGIFLPCASETQTMFACWEKHFSCAGGISVKPKHNERILFHLGDFLSSL